MSYRKSRSIKTTGKLKRIGNHEQQLQELRNRLFVTGKREDKHGRWVMTNITPDSTTYVWEPKK